jgi:hypothetical protein
LGVYPGSSGCGMARCENELLGFSRMCGSVV